MILTFRPDTLQICASCMAQGSPAKGRTSRGVFAEVTLLCQYVAKFSSYIAQIFALCDTSFTKQLLLPYDTRNE